MGLLNRLGIRYLIERGYAKGIKRKQFNMTVAEEMALGVKALAEVLQVPRYVITEHALQVGCYHIAQALKDPERRQQLQEHLAKVHLLGSELLDDESILRLGQDSPKS